MAQAQASTSALSSASFSDFNSKVQAAALSATQSAAGLPADISFHRSIDPELAEDLDDFSAHVLSLTNNLLALVSTGDSSKSNRRKGKAKLQNQDDVVDDFHSLIVDSVDQLLERTDICLDEFLGRTKAPLVAINYDAPALKKTTKANAPSRGQLDPAIQHASQLAKPQLVFRDKVNNNDDDPWYPTISHKFNAQVPLGHHYHDSDADTAIVANHPYRYEITHIAYPPRMFVSADPIPPRPFASTSATWVSTPAALDALLDVLRQAPEIAIDLEHNSYRSYAGIVCLMQISTREQDWIVDTLALRAELATGALNEVLTDPNIVKVCLHGAESDIVWLQQDFNLYIVNLFDTFHASKLLEFPRHGLANLLEMYCDFVPDKRYQLADWRIRPLPEEMLEYARSDTHFLLFIYDNLRNALLDRALSRAQSRAATPSTPTQTSPATPSEQTLIRQALARSEETALRTYEKEVYDAERGGGSGGWDSLARKWNKGALVAASETPSGRETLQRAVYRCVHAWRDQVARADDESTRYVLPNHYLFQLAERPPADMAALLQVFQSVPPVVRRRAKELLEAVRECVKKYFDKSTTPPEVVQPEIRSDEKMEVDGAAEVVPIATSSSRLWSTSHASGTSVAAKSALFGSVASKAVPAAAVLSTSTSSLFGTKGRPTVESSMASRFQEIVARIHSALVTVPSMPVVNVGDSAKQPAEAAQPAEWMQVEVPFVPASQRTTKPKPMDVIVDDAIVVVGQARQKKRKRTKIADADADANDAEPKKPSKKERKASAGGVSGLSTAGEEADADEPFDFSAVPNILDDVPNAEDMRVKKKKKKDKHQNKDKAFYGDFPAPPKAHSDLKSGNQSYTFK